MGSLRNLYGNGRTIPFLEKDIRDPTAMISERATKSDAYWDRAGAQGYGQVMYAGADVKSPIRGRLWQIAIGIADTLCVAPDGRVLDFGCGDGAFANRVLASQYRAVNRFDRSENAIRRAQAEAAVYLSYRAADLVTFEFDSLLLRRLNLFPNFQPGAVYRLLASLEPRIEAHRLWKALCMVDLYGLSAGKSW